VRVQRPAGWVGNPLLHRASVAVLAISESQEGGDQDNDDDDERVSDDHCDDDDDGDEVANGSPSSSQSSEEKQSVHPPLTNLAFDDVAESPAPPLNYQKYLTMQKKRVPITIRYSAESGLKPYCLTVAKRVKDAYPDVFIERVEIDDGPMENAGDPSHPGGTFEVIVDGKLVVRTQKVTGAQRSCVIFVSMSEMDVAITRARKRRRPSTVYGEHGIDASYDALDSKDRMVKARLDGLKQKATELQRSAQRLNDYASASASASATADE